MKRTLLLQILLIAFPDITSKTPAVQKQPEGVISISQYVFPPDAPDPSLPLPEEIYRKGYIYTYFFKSDKIFRKDVEDSSTNAPVTNQSNDTQMSTSLQVKMLHPSYLIDLKDNSLYAFVPRKDTFQVYKMPLDQGTYEPFFRRSDSLSAKFTGKVEPSGVVIAGKKCLKGSATSPDGSTITFYFTKDQIPMRSPLNRFLQTPFPYNVMSIEIPVDWSYPDGHKGIAAIAFQVTKIADTTLNDNLFNLPKNATILKNESMPQLYSSFGN